MYSRLQKSIAVSVDCLDSTVVRNTDVIWLDPNDFPKLLMSLVNSKISSSMPALPHQPEVGELSWEWGWTFRQTWISQVWKDVIEYWNEQESPRGEEI